MKLSGLVFKMVCILLSLVVTLSFVVVGENADANIEFDMATNVLMGFENVASNQNNILHADMQTGLFFLENKPTGKVWYSVPTDVDDDQLTVGTKYTTVRSQLSVGYVDRSAESSAQMPSYANSSVYCTEDYITCKKIENGFRVIYGFEDLGFKVPVNYILKDNYLEASILVNEIYEPDDYFIISINFLPVMGAGNSAVDGKLLIPDGSGAYVNFNNGVENLTDYTSKVYGDDIALAQKSTQNKIESILMPVFATFTEGSGLLGIITQGDANASITFINGNEQCGYNAVSSIFNYRSMSQMEVFTGTGSQNVINRVSRVHSGVDKYTVRYYPLQSDSYIAAAQCYRNYLLNEKKLEENFEPSLLHVDIYGSVDTNGSFLGIPYRKQLTLTEYTEAEKLLKSLKNMGAEALSARYIGWNNSGVSNLKITDSGKAAGRLGGKKKLKNLIEHTEKSDIVLYLDNDIIRFRKGGKGVKKKKDAVKSVFGETASFKYNMLSTASPKLNQLETVFLRGSAIDGVFSKFLKSYEKQNYALKSIGFSVTGTTLYSDLKNKKGMMRDGLQKIFEDIYSKLREKEYKLVFDYASAYAVPFASKILNVPTASSRYDSFNGDVPFYQLVLHGVISMSTSPIIQSDIPENQFLKSVELGCGLSYNGMYAQASALNNTLYDSLYSSSFDLWKDGAIEYYKRYNEIYFKIYDKLIMDYTVLTDSVVKTVYEGGITVYVNYGETDTSVEGVNIEKRSFAVKEDTV